MARLYNLARMTTATTGTGTLTLGSAVSGFLSFAQSGIADGDTITYAIKDGSNAEIGRGTYTSSGTTLSRDTVLASTNSGSKINLSGTAEVFITMAKEDLLGLNDLSTSVGADRLTGWNNSSSALAHVSLGTGLSLSSNTLNRVGGWVLLSSATASASSSIDFTGLDSTYDTYAVTIADVTCGTDAVHLYARFGTGGTPTYQTSSYVWTVPLFGYTANANYSSTVGSTAGGGVTDRMVLTTYATASNSLSNNAAAALSGVYYITSPSSSTKYKRIWGSYSLIRVTDQQQQNGNGGGSWSSTTAITAVRFALNDGTTDRNIAAGTFRLYGIKTS